MDYFEFYGIMETFFPDQGVVKERFLTFSKMFHPDLHLDNPLMAVESLKKSSYNNKVYETLQSFDKTIDYVLSKYNISENSIKLPTNFLMEVMEWNEALQFAEENNNLTDSENIRNCINKEAALIKETLINLAKEYKPGNFECLERMAIEKLKLNFINRIDNIFV